mmetsp:Transcript_48065/g.139234  ORF Transcript_48065/g.139234 Transcript_48065/m.139234 type:complete len:442 (-) Transcript_48065:151-1476(-)
MELQGGHRCLRALRQRMPRGPAPAAASLRGFCAPALRPTENSLVTLIPPQIRQNPAYLGAAAGVAVVGLAFGGRALYNKLAEDAAGQPGAVGRDRSLAKTGVGRQLESEGGQFLLAVPGVGPVVADPAAFSQVVRAQVEQLEVRRAELHAATAAAVKAEVAEAFKTMVPQVGRFADWYFAYGTTYRLLQKALGASARRATSFKKSNSTVAEAVSAEISEYIQQKYEGIVLRPELTDPALCAGFDRVLAKSREGFGTALQAVDWSLLTFVAEKTTHLKQPAGDQPLVQLDWASQRAKVRHTPVAHEKAPLRSAGLAVGGGLAGKAVAAGATKVLLGKLAAPFGADAIVAAGSSVAGATVGSLAGPLGTVTGAMLGLGVDYLISSGISLMQRGEFEKGCLAALATTEAEWGRLLSKEAERVVDCWFDDAITALLQMAPVVGGE